MTMLSRLVDKGLVRKLPGTRTYVYEAAGSPDELAAAAIREVLQASSDPQAVIARFVEQISDDPDLLRRLRDALDREEEP
jgi:predicted transcriptional regulator